MRLCVFTKFEITLETSTGVYCGIRGPVKLGSREDLDETSRFSLVMDTKLAVVNDLELIQKLRYGQGSD